MQSYPPRVHHAPKRSLVIFSPPLSPFKRYCLLQTSLHSQMLISHFSPVFHNLSHIPLMRYLLCYVEQSEINTQLWLGLTTTPLRPAAPSFLARTIPSISPSPRCNSLLTRFPLSFTHNSVRSRYTQTFARSSAQFASPLHNHYTPSEYLSAGRSTIGRNWSSTTKYEKPIVADRFCTPEDGCQGTEAASKKDATA